MSRRFLIFLALVVSFLLTAESHGAMRKERDLGKPVIEIAGSNLPGTFSGVKLMGLDISPDENFISVEFRTVENPANPVIAKGINLSRILKIWVGTWNIRSKELTRYKCIAGPLSPDDWTNAQYTHELRYSHDGRRLVVQMGPRVQVMDADTLETLYSISRAEVPYEPQQSVLIRHFDISSDDRRIAVLTTDYGSGLNKKSAVAIFDFASGRQLHLWTSNRIANTISLSPDGSQILMMGSIVTGGDVGIFNSANGKALDAFETGFREWGSRPNAKIIDQDHFVVVPGGGTDSRGHHSGDAILLFDISAHRVSKTISPKRFGPQGVIALSSNIPLLATISSWHSQWQLLTDYKHAKAPAELRIFRYDTGREEAVFHSLSDGQPMSTVDQYSLRLSTNARYVALFEGEIAKVFEIAPSPGPSKH